MSRVPSTWSWGGWQPVSMSPPPWPEKSVHWDYKGNEVLTPFGAGWKILLFLQFLRILQALLGGFGLVGGSVSIHNTHVVNTVLPLHPLISYEDTPLHIYYVLLRWPFETVLPSTHVANCVDFGVLVHVRWGEGLARKVGNTITELVMTRRDKASILAVKGVVDVKWRATSITVIR